MKKLVAVLGTVLWSAFVHAAPVTYLGADLQTAGIASTATQSDSQFASGAPGAQPVIASAIVFGPTDFASGSGIGAAGLLTGQAEASSTTGFANAAGTAGFIGTFIANTPFTSLHFVIDQFSFTDPSAFSSGSFFILLSSSTVTYLNQEITSAGVFDYLIRAPIGTLMTLNLFLDSEASVISGGNASNFTNVTFQVANVPEPPTVALALLSCIALVLIRRRRPAASAVPVCGQPDSESSL